MASSTLRLRVVDHAGRSRTDLLSRIWVRHIWTLKPLVRACPHVPLTAPVVTRRLLGDELEIDLLQDDPWLVRFEIDSEGFAGRSCIVEPDTSYSIAVPVSDGEHYDGIRARTPTDASLLLEAMERFGTYGALTGVVECDWQANLDTQPFVVLPDLRPAAPKCIMCDSNYWMDAGREAWTMVPVPPGEHRVTVNHGPSESWEGRVVIAAGKSTSIGLKRLLPASGRRRVRFEDEWGCRIETSLGVYAVALRPDSRPGEMSWEVPCNLDADGWYYISHIPSHTSLVSVAVHSDEYEAPTVVLGDEEVERVIRLVATSRNGMIAGRVVDDLGVPVKSAHVVALPPDAAGHLQSAMTNDEGDFFVSRIESHRTQVKLSATCTGYVAAGTLGRVGARDVVIKMAREAWNRAP